MKKVLLNVLLVLFLSGASHSQQSLDSILDFTLSYRGLTQQDITIPVNFDKEKSPTNDSKLILPVVKDIMKNPMRSFGFMDSVMSYKDSDLLTLINKMFGLNNYPEANSIISIRNDEALSNISLLLNDPESFGNELKKFLLDEKKRENELIKNYSKEDRAYLSKYLMSIISESEDAEGSNSDIFLFNKERDSSIAISRNTMDILSRIDRALIRSNSFYNFKTMLDLYSNLSEHEKNNSSNDKYDRDADNDLIYYSEDDGIRIAVGGTGKNIYTGHYDIIIDLGGDDVYNIDRLTDDLFKNNFSCIIDLSGNDLYTTSSNYSLAGTVFSSGFIFDKEGDDTYKGKNVALGSAICGIGILYDESGNDTYKADQFSIGAASFGAGLLVDRNGNDLYIANSYSQGFGMTEGVGAIVDNKGNDNYLIDARSLDIGRYEDHYVSMSQGYGLGLRPYYAGGIGLIIEGEGNDFYSTDIFGQGGAYWYALGCIVDKSGHDKYNSYQYAQGAGIHLAVGLLKDYDGWDFYTSDGVSQGCGHDFGFGLLFDVKGNDNYSAYSLSQGAGNANGIGMLIDESGRDGYLNKEPGNTRGYGNSRREFGSLGIFLDASGEDFYSVGGLDSVISNSSMWGVMNDYYLQDLKSQASGNTFKIPLDSNRNYTQEEYFIMAKTIEPRFSLWQEYGFRKLVEDSLNTPEYITRYFDTDDHRAGLVLRNLSQRLYFTMGNFLAGELKEHYTSMKSKFVLNPNEVAFICYLFGETRNPAGREELLELTSDPNIRIRAAAVNALGKIKIDSSDIDFTERTSKRLRDLAYENSPYKLYKKDIAYAFKNYKNFYNIAALITLLSNDYFGVRFLASDALKLYGDDYCTFIDNNLIMEMSGDRSRYFSFLNSLENLSDGKFRDIYKRCTELSENSDEMNTLYYCSLLKKKLLLTQDSSYKQWLEDNINELQSKSILKIN